MRNLQTLWMAVLLAGCGGPAWDYDAPNGGPSLTVGSGGDASGPSATSAGGSEAQGGAGGEGGTLPFVGTTGQGGGEVTGEGGAGGGVPCEPEANPCDGMPDGACGEWVDSCGVAIVCGNEACSPGILACYVDLQACVCQDATGYTLAVNTCAAMGNGVASFCGDNGPEADTPPTCVDTGVIESGGHVVWCCY